MSGYCDGRFQVKKHARATACGAGVMGLAGLFEALLGPSLLVLPFVPLISLAHAPFALVMGAVRLPGGLGELGIARKTAFIVWA